MTSRIFATCVFALVAVALLAPQPARAGSGPVVALFDMENRGTDLSPQILSNLVDYLAARLTEGGYQVVPPDQMRSRMVQYKQKSHKTCVDQTCQIELGREMAAQKTLSTKILSFGETCQVTGVMYDLKRAATERAATAEAPCNINALLKAVKEISTKLCAPLKSAEKEASRGLAEFEKLSKNVEHEKAERERMEKAWKIVSRIAGDDKVQMDIRVEAVEKFLAEFQKKNPYLSDAQSMLVLLKPAVITLTTEPAGAELTLDGQSVGKAPKGLSLKAGKHKLVASFTGYASTEKILEVKPGEQRKVTVKLSKTQPAHLEVSTIPAGAQLMINGKLAGKTPHSAQLPGGKYTIEVSLSGHRGSTKTVALTNGKKSKVALKLVQIKPGVLNVTSKPAGAQVSVNGKALGKAPLKKEFEAGSYMVSGSLKGFDPVEESISLQEGLTSNLELSLSMPMHSYTLYGHVAFWAGVGMLGLGGAGAGLASAAANDSGLTEDQREKKANNMSIMMWSGLGLGTALVATGVALWVLAPSDEERLKNLAVAPTPDGQGAVMSFCGRW